MKEQKREEEEKFDPKRKPGESIDEYLVRVRNYMKKSGITIEQESVLKRMADSIVKEVHGDEFEEVTKKVKKDLSEVEAIQREIGIRLVRKPGESFKDYLKRLKKAKKNKEEEKL